ncbi:MAG: phosphotransferase, partial [Muribaculaceae bacterium]|nr:phosphotransferase [Muribaculaceae bacterium]
KKGYPANYTGNGGGFMFDCRGMHNPGRYDAYKKLTGLDAPVIEFLKEKGEADLFTRNAFDLVLPTVRRYIKRGFTDLQIGFGCTGGQHRSVYCAQLMGELLHKACPEADVVVIHREQNIRKDYDGK